MLVLGVLIGLAWLAYQVDGARPDWHFEAGWFRLVGVAIFAGFAALYVYCAYQLTQRGRGGYIEFDPPTLLVAEGPYRRVRNPVAGCVVGMLLGEAIALSSTGVLLLFAVALPLAHCAGGLAGRAAFAQAVRQALRAVPATRAPVAAEMEGLISLR